MLGKKKSKLESHEYLSINIKTVENEYRMRKLWFLHGFYESKPVKNITLTCEWISYEKVTTNEVDRSDLTDHIEHVYIANLDNN